MAKTATAMKGYKDRREALNETHKIQRSVSSYVTLPRKVIQEGLGGGHGQLKTGKKRHSKLKAIHWPKG